MRGANIKIQPMGESVHIEISDASGEAEFDLTPSEALFMLNKLLDAAVTARFSKMMREEKRKEESAYRSGGIL